VKRTLESVDAFRVRINKAAVAEEPGLGPINAGPDNWFLGPRIRNAGSIHLFAHSFDPRRKWLDRHLYAGSRSNYDGD
jgi:hypothetical protein